LILDTLILKTIILILEDIKLDTSLQIKKFINKLMEKELIYQRGRKRIKKLLISNFNDRFIYKYIFFIYLN